jgi:hypothetical protein
MHDLLKMLSQNVRRRCLLRRGGLQDSVVQQGKLLAATMQIDGFGGANTQVNSDDLIASILLSANKWQTHIERLLSTSNAKGVYSPNVFSLCCKHLDIRPQPVSLADTYANKCPERGQERTVEPAYGREHLGKNY